ncbi:MAG TPA: hypothetical protein V6D28_26110 [Leptolyngbyaceae cyanobacterium]
MRPLAKVDISSISSVFICVHLWISVVKKQDLTLLQEVYEIAIALFLSAYPTGRL